jgi:hypothetical protein
MLVHLTRLDSYGRVIVSVSRRDDQRIEVRVGRPQHDSHTVQEYTSEKEVRAVLSDFGISREESAGPGWKRREYHRTGLCYRPHVLGRQGPEPERCHFVRKSSSRNLVWSGTGQNVNTTFWRDSRIIQGKAGCIHPMP